MKTVVVRYKVQPDRVAENEELIRGVFEELHRLNSDGIRYASFKQEDGLSFVHIASFDSPESNKTFSELAAFQAFTKEIKDRCEIPPEATPLEQIGNFRLVF